MAIVVPLEEYQRVMQLDEAQLREQDPDLVAVLPHLTADEIRFYLTRGYLPDYPDLRIALNRYDMFKRGLDPVVASLILQLYNNDLTTYLFQTQSQPQSTFTEKILLAYNEVMGYPHLVRALAEANGITLNDYSDEGVDTAFIGALTTA